MNGGLVSVGFFHLKITHTVTTVGRRCQFLEGPRFEEEARFKQDGVPAAPPLEISSCAGLADSETVVEEALREATYAMMTDMLGEEQVAAIFFFYQPRENRTMGAGRGGRAGDEHRGLAAPPSLRHRYQCGCAKMCVVHAQGDKDYSPWRWTRQTTGGTLGF